MGTGTTSSFTTTITQGLEALTDHQECGLPWPADETNQAAVLALAAALRALGLHMPDCLIPLIEGAWGPKTIPEMRYALEQTGHNLERLVYGRQLSACSTRILQVRLRLLARFSAAHDNRLATSRRNTLQPA